MLGKQIGSMPAIKKPHRKTLTDETVSAISDAIRQGKFPSGSQLPSEMELIGILGVSRTTLREALRTLEEQGSIYRKRGLGTFVSEKSIVKDLSINFGITEMIAQAGYTPKTSNGEILIEEAFGKIAQGLEIPEGTRVLVIKRLRLANATPIVWSEDIIPEVILEGRIPSEHDLKTQSLYDYLEKDCDIRIVKGTAVVRPIAAYKEIAEKLHIQRNNILLLISQTDYDGNNRPIIYSIEYHLSDMITFLIQRKGPHRS
jgi:GntR family transcriptional regulator